MGTNQKGSAPETAFRCLRHQQGLHCREAAGTVDDVHSTLTYTLAAVWRRRWRWRSPQLEEHFILCHSSPWPCFFNSAQATLSIASPRTLSAATWTAPRSSLAV